jgi:hypothetical protein
MRSSTSSRLCVGPLALIAAVAAAQIVPGEGDRPDQAVLEKILASLKSQVTDRNFAKLGFADRAEASSATLGVPARRYIVRPDKLRVFRETTDPASVLEDAREWIYPVMAGGNARCMATLAWRPPAGWKPIAFGDQGRARVLFRSRREQSAGPVAVREELFFVVDVLSSNRMFLARRTDGGSPGAIPGRNAILFTWLGAAPDKDKPTQSAETALLYLGSRSRQSGAKRGPGE